MRRLLFNLLVVLMVLFEIPWLAVQSATASPNHDLVGIVDSIPVGQGRDSIPSLVYETTPIFEDVPFDHPYHDDIEALYKAGFTAGCSTDPPMYCPEQTLDREEAAVFLERGVHGDDLVNRGEMAGILVKALGLDDNEPFAVSTYHSIGIYWSPLGGAADKQVLVKFRPINSSEWFDGLPMKYNPISNTELDKATYRGSIVHLMPNSTYEIELVLEGTTSKDILIATTWTEDPPIGETVTFSGFITEELIITESGTPDAYRLYDGRGATIDVSNLYDHSISINASYIIIRGFNLRGARKHIIRIFEGEDIIIEDNDMSNWGEPDPSDDRFGRNYQSAVFANNSSIRRVTIQRNKIHHPRMDSNSWAENHYYNDDGDFTFHPMGPQAITMFNSSGNHVFRYNEIWSDPDHYYNDVIGAGSNGSYVGFPGADSDIYGNYIANCWDDGIEAEGGGQNVRIWSNYVEECFMAIGNAAVSIGPMYIWRNVSGRSYSPQGSKYGEYNSFLKMGYAGSEDWMTGHTYIFHNTIFNSNDEGMGGFGGDHRPIKHSVTRNNIIHVRIASSNSIANSSKSEDIDFDFDLYNRIVPDGLEVNGISGTPFYVNGAGFDFVSMTGNFQLATESLGYDSGQIIPNFNDLNYTGAGPDIGAHESGWDPLLYGVNANENPKEGQIQYFLFFPFAEK